MIVVGVCDIVKVVELGVCVVYFDYIDFVLIVIVFDGIDIVVFVFGFEVG